MEFMLFVLALIGIVPLIVIFVMAYNISQLKGLVRSQAQQTDQLLRLVNKLVNPNSKSINELLSAGITVYLQNGDMAYKLVNVNGVVQYFGKSRGNKEFVTSFENNQFLRDALNAEQLIGEAEYEAFG